VSRIPIKELKDGQFVDLQTFFVSNFKQDVTKNGSAFARFTLADKTGSLQGVCWDFGKVEQAMVALLTAGELMDLSGMVKSYRDNLQFTVSGLAAPSDADPSHFEKVSEFNPDEMYREFLGFVDSYSNGFFLTLATTICNKYGTLFFSKPAATGMHHAFKHGLLEHTLQMLQTAEKLFELPFYANNLNKDLCMFGIMFHDYGKIFEYGDGPGFKKTISGIKVGHIPKMAAIIYHQGTLLGIPDIILDEMMSIVLTHHGRVAWGSPMMPSSPEAQFVHYIDNLHGTVFGSIQRIEGDAGSGETVRHGLGEDTYTLPKLRFNDILKGLSDGNENKNDAQNTHGTAGAEAEVDGF